MGQVQLSYTSPNSSPYILLSKTQRPEALGTDGLQSSGQVAKIYPETPETFRTYNPKPYNP